MLDALGDLGDFIGGVAVVATLFYLALQVRRNTASVRAASRQDIVESFRANTRPLFTCDGMPEIYLEGLRRYPDMAQPDRMKFGAFMTDQLLHFQGVFALHDSGVLDEETYRAFLDVFVSNLLTPGGRAFWLELGVLAPRTMVTEVERHIESAQAPNLLESPFFRID